MGATGTASIDFGAYPGATIASVAVTGQTGILSTSLVEAWIRPADTTNHTHDEHLVDPPAIIAGSIVGGVGFTIYGVNQGGVPVPDAVKIAPTGVLQEQGRISPMPQGVWSVAWVWN